MTRLFAAVAVVVGAIAAVPSSAVAAEQDAPPQASIVYSFERTTPGPATLRWVASYNAGFGQRQLLAAVLTRAEGGQIVDTEFPFVVSEDNPPGGGEAYAGGQRFDCSSTGRPGEFCQVDSASVGLTEFERVDGGGPGQPTGMLVALQGNEVTMQLDESSSGWRLRRTSQTFDVVLAQESAAVGVDGPTSVDGAEVFFSATGRGGSAGSVAIGQPPCGATPLGGPVGVGAGFVELRGGLKTSTVRCPVRSGHDPAAGGVAHGRTTWKLEGPAAGSTLGVSQPRLVIINLPTTPLSTSRPSTGVSAPPTRGRAGTSRLDEDASVSARPQAAASSQLPATGSNALLPLAALVLVAGGFVARGLRR